ncbi:MAG: glycosyltransferase family 2 protein [Acidimicrobiales bacterium]
MATQRHRWFTGADNRERRRRAALHQLALDTARADFERRFPDPRFGPVVALIAAYEEEANLGDVLKGIPAVVEGLEVTPLVVVDGGDDGTERVARDAGVHTCVLPVNLGQGAALRLGYQLAVAHGARFVVTLDADGQNDPVEMGTMLAPLLADDADFVIASRRLGVDQTTDRFRRAGVRLYAATLNRIVGGRLTDTSNGYRAFRAELLVDLLPYLRQDQYQTAEVVITAGRRGWRIAEEPTVWHPRASGESKKGGNLFFGLQYARVIATTWARVSFRPRSR